MPWKIFKTNHTVNFGLMFPSAALTLFFYSVKKNQYNNGTAVKIQLALGLL